jgi:prepilin-type processing-associated H-X9-DG protein
MVVIYEDSPAPDGTRGVAFLDGHAKRINESDWPAIKKASKIP